MRSAADIERACQLVDQALASMARTKRTRTKAYKLLLEARDRMSERITSTDMGDIMRKVYSQEAIDKVMVRRYPFATLLPKSSA